MKVSVSWDTTDGEGNKLKDVELPEKVDIPDEVALDYRVEKDESYITDYLSDEYGFCVNGWYEIEEKGD